MKMGWVSLFCFSLMVAYCQAATYHVPEQFDTIQAAINAAEAGDVIQVGPGTYTDCTHEIGDQYGVTYHCVMMKSGVALISEGGPEVTIIDAQRLGRVIWADSCASGTRLEGFTITGGFLSMHEGAGIYCTYSEIEFVNNIITVNEAGFGGGVFISGGENRFSNCALVNNQAYAYYGGGLKCVRSSSVFEGCRFSGNMARYGGGIVCDGGQPTFTRCLIDHNTASSSGGGIWASDSRAVFNFCTISDNSAPSAATFYTTYICQTSFYCCILAFGIGPALSCSETDSFQCCDVFGHTGGDGLCGIDAGGNFSLDPEFFNRASDDYSLFSSSPCRAGSHPSSCDEETIGAFPGEQTPVERCSWGMIKALYR